MIAAILDANKVWPAAVLFGIGLANLGPDHAIGIVHDDRVLFIDKGGTSCGGVDLISVFDPRRGTDDLVFVDGKGCIIGRRQEQSPVGVERVLDFGPDRVGIGFFALSVDRQGGFVVSQLFKGDLYQLFVAVDGLQFVFLIRNPFGADKNIM